MNIITVEELMYITGGNTKVIIFNQTYKGYVELWRGRVDDVNFNNIPYGRSMVNHVTVVNGEDILQIHIRL